MIVLGWSLTDIFGIMQAVVYHSFTAGAVLPYIFCGVHASVLRLDLWVPATVNHSHGSRYIIFFVLLFFFSRFLLTCIFLE